MKREDKRKMKDDEIALSFSKNFIRKERIPMTSGTGDSYELLVIEMPDEEGEKHEIKRTFTVPVSRVYTDKKHEFVRYTYLKKEGQYRVMRSLYDKEARLARVEETCQMSGQEIADVFNRYRERKRKEFEKTLTPDDQKEGK